MIKLPLMEKTKSRGVLKKLKLAYDADCGFCEFAVGWLASLNFTPGTELELVAYQDPNLLERIPEVDVSHSNGGVQLRLEDGRIICDAAAVGEIFNYTHCWWWLGWLIRLPIAKILAQYIYRIVATNRGRISLWLGLNACRLRLGAKTSHHL